MFNRVPADENQAESAHKVPKVTLTMAELADELHISLPTARKLVRKSGFPAFNVGSRILINREGLQRWLDGQPPIAVTCIFSQNVLAPCWNVCYDHRSTLTIESAYTARGD